MNKKHIYKLIVLASTLCIIHSVYAINTQFEYPVYDYSIDTLEMSVTPESLFTFNKTGIDSAEVTLRIRANMCAKHTMAASYDEISNILIIFVRDTTDSPCYGINLYDHHVFIYDTDISGNMRIMVYFSDINSTEDSVLLYDEMVVSTKTVWNKKVNTDSKIVCYIKELKNAVYFSLPGSAVNHFEKLTIYDTKGRLVYNKIDIKNNFAIWDRHNIKGEFSGAGYYFATIYTTDGIHLKKMFLH